MFKKIMASFLVLVLLNVLSLETRACKDKDGGRDKNKFFSLMDVNADGKLTSTEMSDHATKMFKEHDNNNDGIITLNDVKTDVNAKFVTIDKNKDGFVNQDELKTHFKGKHKEWSSKNSKV